MAPELLAEAERLLRSGADLDAVCSAVGVCRRTLERNWRETHGVTLGRWRRENGLGPIPAEVSPVVSFRLRPSAHAALCSAASAAGQSPGDWAKGAVLRELDAVAGVIDHPDPPSPQRPNQPAVIVAGASESGPRWAVTRLLSGQAEDDAPQVVRRARRRR